MSDQMIAERVGSAHRTLGAVVGEEATSFLVWAPEHDRVELVVYAPGVPMHDCPAQESGTILRIEALTARGDGYWTGRFDDLGPGTLYKYRLGGDPGRTFPDPASRYQPGGVHGPSQVVDPWAFGWTDARWAVPSFDRLVFYELHVGTFSPQGTFLGLIELLPRLVELGVTAVEVMPVADFPGTRNWGYDGVDIFAPARCYGTPDDLRRLVDAAHQHGLAFFLDVVYNHFGPDGAYANVFSAHYFTDAHRSPWGRGVNLDGPHSAEVRRFFIENAVHWATEYHVDGLRLDATHALVDDSPQHFLAELTTTVRAQVPRPIYFVAEDHRNLATILQPVPRGGNGIDAVWADDFHHQVRVHTAGDHEGYYADFTGSASDIARTLTQGWFFTGQRSSHLDHPRGTDPSPLSPEQFVICIQNHDQIGNRADGARLNHEAELPAFCAASTLLLLGPLTPLLFMGQEWASSSPFLFFTDHTEELGRKVTEGRRDEFGSFASFADPRRRAAIPDPQAVETFNRSRLDWTEALTPPHDGVRRLYTRLLELRRAQPAFPNRTRDSYTARALDDHTVSVTYRDRGLVVIARLGGGAGAVRLDHAGTSSPILTTEDPQFVPDPRPILVEAGTQPLIRFARPGAVVMPV